MGIAESEKEWVRPQNQALPTSVVPMGWGRVSNGPHTPQSVPESLRSPHYSVQIQMYTTVLKMSLISYFAFLFKPGSSQGPCTPCTL